MATKPTDITGIEIGGIRLEPTSPTLAGVLSVLRGLGAAVGVIITLWSFVPTRNLAGLYAYVHTNDFLGFLGWAAAVVCLGWGYWKKLKDKADANTLKATVRDQHVALQSIADNAGTTPQAIVQAAGTGSPDPIRKAQAS